MSIERGIYMKKSMLTMTVATVISSVLYLIYLFTYNLWKPLVYHQEYYIWWCLIISALAIPLLIYNIIIPFVFKNSYTDVIKHKGCSIITVIIVSVLMLFFNELIFSATDIVLNDDLSGFICSFLIGFIPMIINSINIFICCLWSIIRLKRQTKS